MNRPQKIALAHPCLMGGEVFQPQFASDIPGATLLLTVNAGHE